MSRYYKSISFNFRIQMPIYIVFLKNRIKSILFSLLFQNGSYSICTPLIFFFLKTPEALSYSLSFMTDQNLLRIRLTIFNPGI